MKISRVRMAAVVAIVGSVLLSSGCGNGGKSSSSWQGGGAQPGASAGADQPAPEPTLNTVSVVSPATDEKGVKVLGEVKYESEDPENTTVTVTDDDGKEVEGTLDKDGKVWRPAKSLAWKTKYTVSVKGPEAEGKNSAVTSSFTTMAKPGKTIGVSSFLGDGRTVGVGMPIIVRFSRAIPEKVRGDVERRMSLTATPAQVGTWHWTSPTEVHYRPQKYWKTGTKIFYNVQLKGLELGNGYFGRNDLSVDNVKIGRSFVMTVSNKTKRMTVKQNGKVIKTIPVSLGKPSTPSSSGTMVVIEKKEHTIFDTTDELGPEDGYKTPIDFAQRITWSGQFIHAAPWSEGKQGHTNVSHGCVNVSMAMGAWLFQRTMMGDPITVKGTEEKLKNGNGWTDWNMSWDEYKKGSAV